MATSQSRGHEIKTVDGEWEFTDTNERAFPCHGKENERECGICGKPPVKVLVKCYNTKEMVVKRIDPCIAELVHALQRAGINMVSSCCGHSARNGWISLADGRTMVITKTGHFDVEVCDDENS